ncbi:MAG TPA: sensor histidine kinase [Casimicrobiaceae bacterium]|nr:sensor histidine kinase [Casimicrobiaceae bacterium]
MTRDTLRRRLAKTLVLPLLVLYAISGGLAYGVARHYANQVYDRWLFDSAMSLARQVRLSGDHAALDLPRAAQEIFEWDDEDITLFRVVGTKSGHIAGYPDLPLHGGSSDHFRNASFYDAPARGRDMRWASLVLGPADVGETVTVTVGETMHKRERLQDEILFAVWVPQLAVMFLVALVTYRAITSQTQRIHTLSHALHDLSVTRLHPVPDKDMPEELLPLTEALNAMLAKVDRAAMAQRSFIANAAHQLRTPLTTINLLAEQARHCTTVEDMRKAVTALQAAASRTARLANQLLLLSRAEPDAQSAHNRTVLDLYELAFETAREWAGKAIATGIDLGFDESSVHVQVEVDGALIGEAINNLLDNALKYCPAGAHVTVAVSLLPDPTIVVEDTGSGIEESERSRVVKRFHRGDNATQSGTGLGLAIVNEIALAHSGKFVIRDAAGGGARFEIHLPGGTDRTRQSQQAGETAAVRQA